MSYINRNSGVPLNLFGILRSGSGTVELVKFNNQYYYSHRGTAAGQTSTLYHQMSLPIDAVSATSVSLIVNKSGSTNTNTLTVYINGTPDASINGYDIKPVGPDNVDTQYVVPFGSLAVAGTILTLAITSTVDTNEVHRYKDLIVNYNTRSKK